MVAAQAGDGIAYEALLRELLPFIRRRVAARISVVSDREDVVQNVLVGLHRARHTYRPEHPFTPWLGAIVRNATIDALRRRGRRTRFEWAGDPETLPEPSAVEPDSDASALGAELESALASLPSAQREAVELIHLEGLSVAEAAERVGATPGALKVRAHRGYRAMRALLARRGS